MKNLYRYVAPAAVIQSVMIGGGYGTGREIVEYFSRHGLTAGLLGLGVAFISFAVIITGIFELSRRWSAYDYMSFISRLIGRFSVLFELAFLLLLVLILAVIGSAAGDLLLETVGIPRHVTTISMLTLVGVLTFWGRDTIVSILTFWTVVLYAVFITYFLIAFFGGHLSFSSSFSTEVQGIQWASDGVVYVLYNAAIIPALLYTIRRFETGGDSVIGGILAGAFVTFPALLFHLAFSGSSSAVIDSATPVFESISAIGLGWLIVAYLCVLFGTFIETGLGLLQGVIERIDRAFVQRGSKPLPKIGHAAVAVGLLVISTLLSSLGVIALIGNGYRYTSYLFFLLLVLPVLFHVGRNLVRGEALQARERTKE